MVMKLQNAFKIGVLGLGYVGLPLAIAFARKHKVVASDISKQRISQLVSGFDETGEVDPASLRATESLMFTCEIADIKNCNFYVVTVPTPIDECNEPDLSAVRAA